MWYLYWSCTCQFDIHPHTMFNHYAGHTTDRDKKQGRIVTSSPSVSNTFSFVSGIVRGTYDAKFVHLNMTIRQYDREWNNRVFNYALLMSNECYVLFKIIKKKYLEGIKSFDWCKLIFWMKLHITRCGHYQLRKRYLPIFWSLTHQYWILIIQNTTKIIHTKCNYHT